MKNIGTKIGLIVALMLSLSSNIKGQSVEIKPGEFYAKVINAGKRAEPLPVLREADICWELGIWRTIDLREKFNQFFYFPIEAKGVDGRKNFAYMLWDAVSADIIPIYEDDEFKIPLDNTQFVTQYTKADTVILEIVDENENYEYKTVLVPKEFNSEEILQIKLKEAWYIDNLSSQQHVLITGLAITRELYKEISGEKEYIGNVNLFWIPMLNTEVRNHLARKEAYYEDNIANLPSWMQIFSSRMFDSFITREDNRMNRSISDFLSGTDAILESSRIEEKLLNISMDIWEY